MIGIIKNNYGALKYIVLCAFISLFSFAHGSDVLEVGAQKKLPVIHGTPLIWGVDYAGYTPSAAIEADVLRDFGFDLVVYHYRPQKSENEFALNNLSRFYEENSAQWILNLERSNWTNAFIDSNGNDWYNDEDGLHYFMFPDKVLRYLSNLSNKPGILYDEAAHMQNSRNYKLNRPFWLKAGEAQSLYHASDAFLEKARKIAKKYQSYGLELYSEHVFPVQFHTLADAGFIPVSKILKENNIPAYIATAIGAALQYDKSFWLTPDLWHKSTYPGHTAEEYKSALLIAYHMGAEGIYTENLGFEGSKDRQGEGSLIKVDVDDNGYDKTAWGKVAKWFRWEYVPANPRTYEFDDLIPRVAIVRKEDTSWGQSDSWLEDELFGVEGWKSTPTTEAWLEIWSLLSNGQINKNSISWHNRAYSDLPYQIFYPLDGVVVFDEKVRGVHLRDVELIFLTGMGISEKTLNDVKARVMKGALCISLPSLAPAEVVSLTTNNGSVSYGQGKWVVSESFLSNEVKKFVQPFLPQENYIRYQFGETQVQFRPIDGDNNRIKVRVN